MVASRGFPKEVPDTEAGPKQAGSAGRRGLRHKNIVPPMGDCPEFSGLPGRLPASQHLTTVRSTTMSGKIQTSVLIVSTVMGFALIAACNPPASDQHLQEQAAQATNKASKGPKVAQP